MSYQCSQVPTYIAEVIELVEMIVNRSNNLLRQEELERPKQGPNTGASPVVVYTPSFQS